MALRYFWASILYFFFSTCVSRLLTSSDFCCVIKFHFKISDIITLLLKRPMFSFYSYLLREKEYLKCKYMFTILTRMSLASLVCMPEEFSVFESLHIKQPVMIHLSLAISFFTDSGLLSFFRFASFFPGKWIMLHLQFSILFNVLCASWILVIYCLLIFTFTICNNHLCRCFEYFFCVHK